MQTRVAAVSPEPRAWEMSLLWIPWAPSPASKSPSHLKD